MSENPKKSNQQADNGSTEPDADLGQAELQKAADEAAEKGYYGTTPDPTPNENYTVDGVIAGKPTPETDEALAEEARKATGRS